MKCEYVAELGRAHKHICKNEATTIVKCLVPGTNITTSHHVCPSHALAMEARYGAASIPLSQQKD